MTHLQSLERRIAQLEQTVELLMGKPRGPITMTQARLANERGDLSIVERFEKQYMEQLNERRERRQESALCVQAAGDNS